jgi:hypothetical protein
MEFDEIIETLVSPAIQQSKFIQQSVDLLEVIAVWFGKLCV